MRRIEISGQVLEIAEDKPLPPRALRDAWIGDEAGGVTIDPIRALVLTQERLTADVDAKAEALRERVSTNLLGKSHEYAFLALEAAAVMSIAAGQVPNAAPITKAAFPLLGSSVGIDVPETGNEAADVTAAAQLVHGKRGQMYAAFVAIRRARLVANKAIRAARTHQDAEAAATAIVWPSL